MTFLAKGQPPDTLWGQLVLWWHEYVIGYGEFSVNWTGAIIALVVLALMAAAAVRR